MAVTRVRERVYGIAGAECHGGCGHRFTFGEPCFNLRGVTDAYVYWCEDCTDQYPEEG